jgi:hypothetical protein
MRTQLTVYGLGGRPGNWEYRPEFSAESTRVPGRKSPQLGRGFGNQESEMDGQADHAEKEHFAENGYHMQRRQSEL